MNDPPPPYSSIDESKAAAYLQHGYYPQGAGPANPYAAGPPSAPYPDAPGYHGAPGPAPYHQEYAEPQPQILVAPTGFGRVQNTIRNRYSSVYGTHILLSCFVICCCGPGFVCGLAAFCIAICAQSFADTSPQLSRQLGVASVSLSLGGIAISFLTVIVFFSNGGFVRPGLHNLTVGLDGNETIYQTVVCMYRVVDRCFNSRKLVKSRASCFDGFYLDRYCYRQEQIPM